MAQMPAFAGAGGGFPGAPMPGADAMPPLPPHKRRRSKKRRARRGRAMGRKR